MTFFQAVTLAVGFAALAFPVPSEAKEKSVQYPILVDDIKALHSAGIMLGGYGKKSPGVAHFKNLCYYYGDGGYELSVSDEFLQRYKARGFTLNSLCLALVSGIRFDPETGKRLPTYIFGDFVELKKQIKKYSGVEPGIVTDQLPLGIPDCFKEGTPYSDCKMNFDPRTGKQHKASTVAFYAELGQQIEGDFKKNKAEGRWKSPCIEDDSRDCYRETEIRPGIIGYLARAWWPREKYPSANPESWQHQTFFTVSPKLPKGFGYALYADGAAGSDPEAETLESAQSGSAYATSAEIASATKSYP